MFRKIAVAMGVLATALSFSSQVSAEVTRQGAKIIDEVFVRVLDDQFLEIPGDNVGPDAVSRLVRRPDSLALNFKSDSLEPGPYTLWWLIFNRPFACEDSPCKLIPDLISGEGGEINTATGATAIRAANAVVAATGPRAGKLDVSAYLEVGGPTLPGSLFGELRTPLWAEVHVVLKNHGDLIGNSNIEIIDNLAEQLYDVNGGCEINFPFNPPPLCPDPQIAIHQIVTFRY